MNNVMRFSLILIGLVLMVLVGVKAQTNDAQKWYTTGPESDFKDSMVYQAQSDFGGKHYSSTIYGRDLEDVAKWKEGKDLPISISKIRVNAQNAFRKQFPQFSQFKIMSINLVHLTLVDDWVVDVEFNGTDFAAVSPGSFEDKKINVLVLLNGRVIPPTETAK